MPQPLVSVVCLCYNHERFLAEALDSVLAQTYPNLEIVVVDDRSTDGSAAIIQQYVRLHPQLKFIQPAVNVGNCAAFNMGWRASQGDFIIDFATDDVLLPNRIAEQVAAFQKLDSSYGVMYTDAAYIDDDSNPIGFHYKRNPQGELLSYAPSGDVFKDLLGKYIICPPTMMMRREVFEDLNGYDETLAYEDFDFWVRSSRKYKYFYLDKVTTKRRVHTTSLSKGFYKTSNRLLASTVKVCAKAAELVQSPAEEAALEKRLKYEARHAYLTGNYKEAHQLLLLLKKQSGLSPVYKLIYQLNKYKIDLSVFRTWYYRYKYEKS
ncbi:glycosyltransferase family 2 protein [Pontibacter harenae]|uniref:glycosyltransferase family 2 protein n=1 Tax=Pontibacter harenae TaxID=2894083 RepID=UPI001E37C12B|nr:glycosyltransferase [Pontibacter harenae]MCC9166011.1 glycosyltransferase [Pontibacter harenae]